MTGAWTSKAMPDPRDPAAPAGATCRIRATVPALLWHIGSRHVVARGEPWDRWLPPGTVEAIRHLARKYPPETALPAVLEPEAEASLSALSSRIEDQAEWGLKAPLVVRVVSCRPDPVPKGEPLKWKPATAAKKWIVVLPVGAVMVATVRGPKQVYLTTCFFDETVTGLDDPATRCRDWLTFYANRYADDVAPPGAPGKVLPRGPDRVKEIRSTETAAVELTKLDAFVTWVNWGFEAEPPHARVLRQPKYYVYRPEAIPGPAEMKAPPGGKRRRLNPGPPPPPDDDDWGKTRS
jgi:hypothetical protein